MVSDNVSQVAGSTGDLIMATLLQPPAQLFLQNMKDHRRTLKLFKQSWLVFLFSVKIIFVGAVIKVACFDNYYFHYCESIINS